MRALSGFTLLEISVVLIIIALIAGGVLMGRDMVASATIRAQISQMEKFQLATSQFHKKYGFLPGDIPDPQATSFGFIPRGGAQAGDGNGLLEGRGANPGYVLSPGENAVFWVDLSAAGLLDKKFNTARQILQGDDELPHLKRNLYFPKAKISPDSYVFTWSDMGKNFFNIGKLFALSEGLGKLGSGAESMTSAQAHAIDKKMDDGIPTMGKVLAIQLVKVPMWAGGVIPANTAVPLNIALAPGNPYLSCFDNGNIMGAPMHYTDISNKNQANTCSLAFRFQ